ncbi:MAG: hypothetical protein HOM55_11235 [Proteobacteria bacterium]|jgi:hypothetical protein|nr:hypothetical protein [Pseudomonadota bacterium]
MPGCIFRVTGTELNVDECLALGPFEANRIDRKGEPRHPKMPDGRINEHDGFTVLVNDDAVDEVSHQIREAQHFLEQNKAALHKLTSRMDVDETCLDFGWDFPVANDTFAQFNYFPPSLLRLCGDLNIGIEISVYATED